MRSGVSTLLVTFGKPVFSSPLKQVMHPRAQSSDKQNVSDAASSLYTRCTKANRYGSGAQGLPKTAGMFAAVVKAIKGNS